jgi:hypothetical protein
MIAFRCYDPSLNQGGGIHAWYKDQPPRFRAQIDSALQVVGREATLSKAPQLKWLRGACKGLIEIRIDFEFEGNEIHIRILGIEASHGREFVLLVGFQKIGNAAYGPTCRAAHARAQGVGHDERRAPPCRFP